MISYFSDKRLKTAIFAVICLTVLIFTKTVPGMGWSNDTSRLAATESIVERGTFVIDDSYFVATGDKVRIGDHFYSDKTPIVSLYMAIPYWILYNIFGASFRSNPEICYYILSVLSTGLSTLLLSVFLYRLLKLKGASERMSLFLTAAGYFATITMSYSLVITNHIPAAAFILCAYYYVFSQKPLTGGIFAGLAVFADPEAIFLLAPIIINKHYSRIIMGGAPIAAIFMYWNYSMSGSILPFQMQPELFKFEGSYFSDAETLSGTAIKHKSLVAYLVYLFHYTIGGRGLFIYSPITILGVAGLLIFYRKFPYFLASFILFVLGTTLTTNNYSGWSYGVRWHLLVIPILVIGSFPLLEIQSRAIKSFAAVLLTLGIVLASIGAIDPYTMTDMKDSSLRSQLTKESRYVKYAYLNGIQLIATKQYAYAESRFRESLRRDSDFLPAKDGLAKLFYIMGLDSLKSGKYDDAKMNFEKSMRWNPGFRPAKEALAKLVVAIEMDKLIENKDVN